MWIGHIYYALGLIPLLMTLAMLVKLSEYNRIKEWYIKFEEITKSKPKKTDFRTPEEYNTYTGISGIVIVDFLWIILGILTQSWYIFLTILAISIIINGVKKLTSINVVSDILTSIILITKFSVYLYLIINHFHLHYDTWQVVKDFIK